jgi:hypothetical protein
MYRYQPLGASIYRGDREECGRKRPLDAIPGRGGRTLARLFPAGLRTTRQLVIDIDRTPGEIYLGRFICA